jgi:hypothetical protein
MARVLTELRVPHAFTTRASGVSAGHFASLTFGNPAKLRHAQFEWEIQHARNLAQLLAEAKAAHASPELLTQIQNLVNTTLETTPAPQSKP